MSSEDNNNNMSDNETRAGAGYNLALASAKLTDLLHSSEKVLQTARYSVGEHSPIDHLLDSLVITLCNLENRGGVPGYTTRVKVTRNLRAAIITMLLRPNIWSWYINMVGGGRTTEEHFLRYYNSTVETPPSRPAFIEPATNGAMWYLLSQLLGVDTYVVMDEYAHCYAPVADITSTLNPRAASEVSIEAGASKVLRLTRNEIANLLGAPTLSLVFTFSDDNLLLVHERPFDLDRTGQKGDQSHLLHPDEGARAMMRQAFEIFNDWMAEYSLQGPVNNWRSIRPAADLARDDFGFHIDSYITARAVAKRSRRANAHYDTKARSVIDLIYQRARSNSDVWKTYMVSRPRGQQGSSSSSGGSGSASGYRYPIPDIPPALRDFSGGGRGRGNDNNRGRGRGRGEGQDRPPRSSSRKRKSLQEIIHPPRPAAGAASASGARTSSGATWSGTDPATGLARTTMVADAARAASNSSNTLSRVQSLSRDLNSKLLGPIGADLGVMISAAHTEDADNARYNAGLILAAQQLSSAAESQQELLKQLLSHLEEVKAHSKDVEEVNTKLRSANTTLNNTVASLRTSLENKDALIEHLQRGLPSPVASTASSVNSSLIEDLNQNMEIDDGNNEPAAANIEEPAAANIEEKPAANKNGNPATSNTSSPAGSNDTKKNPATSKKNSPAGNNQTSENPAAATPSGPASSIQDDEELNPDK